VVNKTAREDINLAGETILVVDDGRENREFLVEYVLTPNGYQPLEARDGKEGLDTALERRPDLILLDLQMPRMNGLEVLDALSAQHADIPVILMTFHGSEEIAIEVYRKGVRDYVRKPYSVDEMLEAIERSLSEVRVRKEKEALTQRVLQANQDLQQRLQELKVLYNVGKSVTSITDMNQLLPRIVDAAAEVTQAEDARLYLLYNNRLICRAQKENTTSQAKPTDFEANDPIAQSVIEKGKPLILTPEQLGNSSNLVSAAYAPLILRNEVIGVLGVNNASVGAHIFTRHHSAMLSTLTDYAAIAIENSHNFEALKAAKEWESAKNEHIRGTFERFVPPAIVDQALKRGDTLRPGGTRREISILFADIRGYTTWSEDAPPEEVIETLNHYLSMAAEVILGWNGTLDKFMGDGLMAIFNAPEEQEDHIHRAADAALALLRAANEVTALHGHDLSYSIGVNVGEAVVGYVGTERAMNYTAIGDGVNLAKRLQEYAQPGQILVSEAVIQRLGDLAQAKPLGEVKLKGRKKQTHAYELLGLMSVPPER
jgi:class 3 adenylate cyclase/DNA-binding response OmpR family regulator